MAHWNYTENGFWELEDAGRKLLKAYACAEGADGRKVDTRSATLEAQEEADGVLLLRFAGEEGLILTERLGPCSLRTEERYPPGCLRLSFSLPPIRKTKKHPLNSGGICG